jgi:hypothetical protein
MKYFMVKSLYKTTIKRDESLWQRKADINTFTNRKKECD